MNGCAGILKGLGLGLAFFALVGLLTAALIWLPSLINSIHP